MKSNRDHLKNAMASLEAILADVKEKNEMMDAVGNDRHSRYDDLGECEQILENMQTELDRLYHLL